MACACPTARTTTGVTSRNRFRSLPLAQAADLVRVFAAQVNIGVGWQNAFVVSSDVPEAE